MMKLILSSALITLQVWSVQHVSAQTQVSDAAVTWMPTTTVPTIVSVYVSEENNSLLLKIPNELVETSVEPHSSSEVITSPELTIDHTIVQKRRFVLVTQQFRLDEIEFYNVDGDVISMESAVKRLANSKTAIYGMIPSRYLRSILKDDLVCIVSKKPDRAVQKVCNKKNAAF